MNQPPTPSPKPSQGIASGNEAATDIVRAILNGDTELASKLVAKASIKTLEAVLSALMSLGITGEFVQEIQNILDARKMSAAKKAKQIIP